MSITTTQTPAAKLRTVWERTGASRSLRPSVTLQLAVVQYCTDVPGTPVPTLDDMTSIAALVQKVTGKA